MKNSWLTMYAITIIAILEGIAIWNKIDGWTLAISIAIIALLAPSPAFQLNWRDWSLRKNSTKEQKVEAKQ